METRWSKRFGRYEIIAEIGRGAMGVVYKARDPKIDRFVAVKTISLSGHSPEEQREYRDRFFHEAQAAGRLLHPGIVTVFDTGEEPEGRIAYIVMEYIAGQSLEQVLSRSSQKLSLSTALLLAEELAEALDHAHAQGVVHRDLKPANILVTSEGHAKIADFGIAILNSARLTLDGRSLGTPAYMSPEQLEGDAVDQRSDLFSLGAILYHMVTGYGPFQGNSATTVCFKVANRDPIRATSLDPDLPAEVDSLVARAMAKDPSQRYQRGLDFALDLREVRQGLSKDAKGGLQFSKTGEPIVPPVLEEVTHDSSANRSSLTSAETPIVAAPGSFTLVPYQAPPWWRAPAVRLGILCLVALILVGVLAFQHFRPSRTVSQTSAPVAVAVAAEPIPPMSDAGSNSQGARRVPNAKIPARTVPDSRLEIHIEHRFSSADLTLWIDDKMAYQHSLKGQSQKHWNPFRLDVRETESVRLSAGEHNLRIRVRSLPDQFDQSSTISGSFAKDRPALLQINFERQRKAMRLSLR